MNLSVNIHGFVLLCNSFCNLNVKIRLFKCEKILEVKEGLLTGSDDGLAMGGDILGNDPCCPCKVSSYQT